MYDLLQTKLSSVGITRLAKITHLDRLGIPTWQSIRPSASTLCVSQGKGVDDIHAKISAIMESIEFFCWENHNPEFEWISINQTDVIDPSFFCEYLYDSKINESTLLPMSKIKDIVSGNSFNILHDLISIKRNNVFGKKPKWAYCTTNGISGGATFNEAVLYAIFEIIERDSECCATSFFSENFFRPNILIPSIHSSVIQNLIEKIYTAGCDIQIFQNINDFNIPSFSTYIIDKSNVFYTNKGYGAHLNPVNAIVSSIVEAAQGRLTMISGSREDNYRYDYNFVFEVGNTIHQRCLYELHNSKKIDFDDSIAESFSDLDEALHFVFDVLVTNGYKKILVEDISKLSIPIVKVLIPGLCGYHLPLRSRLNTYFSKMVIPSE